MEDVSAGPGVSCQSSWTSTAQLSDVLLSVLLLDGTEQLETAAHKDCTPVLLEQETAGDPCVLTLTCEPQTVISSLLLTSQARTTELYSPTGDYCGTCRGVQTDSAADTEPFYTTQLNLDNPSASCQVKLLSLGGRSSVAVGRIVVGLRPAAARQQHTHVAVSLSPSFDMQHVQSLVEEMGASLSPGAQSLMEMVNFQQKNQTASGLGSLLPLLMGGGTLSALAGGAHHGPPSTFPVSSSSSSSHGLLPPDSSCVDSASAVQNGDLRSDESSCASSSGGRTPRRTSAQMADMMSQFLNAQASGQGCGQALSSTPDLLPMLQDVCGQVTQCRLDANAAARARDLGDIMERRLEEMEKRLKEHMDRRLDALEEKLDRALQAAMPLLSLNPPAGGDGGGSSIPQHNPTSHT